MSDTSSTPLLRAENLTKHFGQDRFLSRFFSGDSPVQALNDVSFEMNEGEVLGVVGESGCGKSTLGRTVLRLHEPTEGSVYFEDVDIMEIKKREMNRRRKDMQIIFQDVSSSLNPRMTAAEIISEPMRIHDLYNSDAEYEEEVYDILDRVKLGPESYDKYPHEFSGGQKQRVMVGRALSTNPRFLVADEPVSALDVSVQARVLNVLKELQEDLGITVLFIGHDISVVQFISDRIAVMYLGEIVEVGKTECIINDPHHPYTQALLSSKPQIGKERGAKIHLEGEVPSPTDPPAGCSFHTRCPYKTEECTAENPELESVQPDHDVACYYHETATSEYEAQHSEEKIRSEN